MSGRSGSLIGERLDVPVVRVERTGTDGSRAAASAADGRTLALARMRAPATRRRRVPRPQRRRLPARGRARAQAREAARDGGRCASSSASTRRRPTSTSATRSSCASCASSRTSATGRADRRRLHRARRRSERALVDAARALRRGDRRQRRGPTRSRRSRSCDRRPGCSRCAATASGSTWRMEDLFRARAHDDRRPAARARRLRQALRGRASRSRCSSCSIRCCRATTRSRSRADVELGGTDQKFNLLLGRDVQRAYGSRRAGRPHDADPARASTASEKMSKSLGNHIGVDRAARGDLRQDAARCPTRRWRRGTALLAGEAARRTTPPRDAKRALARGARRALPRRRRPPRRPRRTSTASSSSTRCPTTSRRRAFAPTDGRVHLPALIADGFGGSRSEARRLLAQGGVQLDGEPLGRRRSDLPAERLDGAVLQVGKRQFRRLRSGAGWPSTRHAAPAHARATATIVDLTEGVGRVVRRGERRARDRDRLRDRLHRRGDHDRVRARRRARPASRARAPPPGGGDYEHNRRTTTPTRTRTCARR